MGIYLSDMEMPKERESFTLTIKYNGLVFDTETGIQVAEAQEVPEHGRLIEAEPIMKFIQDGLNSGEFGYDTIKVMAEIYCAPTIISSEEGET